MTDAAPPIAVTAAESVPQRIAATTIGIRNVSATGGNSWMERISSNSRIGNEDEDKRHHNAE